MIRLVNITDIEAWLKLASEVENLFGKMSGVPEFENGIRHCIENQSAFCDVNSDGEILGIIAIDKTANEICWFVVGKDYRGMGAGKKLLQAALDNLSKLKPVLVQTFASEIPEGKAARKLYMKFGFEDFKQAEKNPAGIPTVIMRKTL